MLHVCVLPELHENIYGHAHKHEPWLLQLLSHKQGSTHIFIPLFFFAICGSFVLSHVMTRIMNHMGELILVCSRIELIEGVCGV